VDELIDPATCDQREATVTGRGDHRRRQPGAAAAWAGGIYVAECAVTKGDR
jgi:hypothetical protein